MKKHFVIFYSPGTFVSETTQNPIDSWDVEQAIDMALKIKERHGATPYGFQFITRERKGDEFDSKEVERSATYFLGGKVLTLKEVEERNDPKDSILISNMRGNEWDRIVENCNSWKIVLPLRAKDVVLEFQVNTK